MRPVRAMSAISGLPRIALDLSGPHEPLGNWMALLADALITEELCEVVRFRTENDGSRTPDITVGSPALWRPWWYRSMGRRIDRYLTDVDVVHVAGRATPRCGSIPMLISVDDLRPLRDDAKDRQRVAQLLRAVRHGARIVATSRSASIEVQRSLKLGREEVTVVSPAVAWDQPVTMGTNLVVNLAGQTDAFLSLAPELVQLAHEQHARVVVLASQAATSRIRQRNLDVDIRSRRDASDVLMNARAVVHLSDGARFPSFTIAALAAGVPTCATPTSVNRELLEGAAVLMNLDDAGAFVESVKEIVVNDSRRAVLIAAGRHRASDFAPSVAARSFAELYSDTTRRVVRA